MTYQDLVSNFPYVPIHKIENLPESRVDLELNTANGTQLPCSFFCKNISTHDLVLKGSTTTGSIHLVWAVMPASVQHMEDYKETGL